MKNLMLILIASFFFGACSTPSYLPKPMEFKQHVNGLILKFQLDEKTKILGEIIEVGSDTLTLLSVLPEAGQIMAIPKKDIQEADIIIAATSDQPKMVTLWAGLLSLIPAGHGRIMVVSAPITLATTITAGVGAAKSTYRMNYPEQVSWDQLNKFARFPQGIPPNIELSDLE